MGLVVSRLVTGCGKIQQCLESTKLTFNKVNGVRLVEETFEEVDGKIQLVVVEETCVSLCNLVEYWKNRKCTNLPAELTVNDVKYETNVTDLKYCDKKLRVTLEKNLDIPEVCNKCVSLKVYSCISDENAKLLKRK